MYEDLIFVEHNAFVLRMEAKGEEVGLFFNRDLQVASYKDLSRNIITSAREFGLEITPSGTFSVQANESDSTLDIAFNKNLKQ